VRAPSFFNPLFARHGVDAVLVPAQVARADVEGFVRHVLKARNIDGLWLTIPHKSALFGMLDRCDRRGTLAQAVNAVRRNADGSIEGALFDGEGFARGLDDARVPLRGTRALVFGTGGAGAAVAVSIAERAPASLTLHDADAARAHALAARLRAAFPIDVRVAGADPAGHDLVVHATPLGLRADDPMPFDPARLDAGATVVDILMTPQPTPLLQACRARDLRVFDGVPMMENQAAHYLAYFGLPPLLQAH
jgi:shikimate dehydrogenase